MPSLTEVYEKTVRHFLQPILPLLDDPSVSEVLVNGADNIYFERAGKLHDFDGRFSSNDALMAAVCNIAEYVGRQIDDRHHSMDGRLPTGERVHAIVPPASRSGICLSIRKFRQDFFGLQQLVDQAALTAEAAEFLELAVMLHKNIVVAGGTGTGKTTLLNALSAAIPSGERIIVIEDSSELQLQQPHTVYLEAQPGNESGQPAITIRQLFADSLRMRPDRIIVGEVRRGEALDLIQSMISGHAGSLTTVHANTPRDAASRLETLCMQSDTELPIYVARSQVASAIHLVVQLTRMSDGTRRITAIDECLGLDDDQRYAWNPLYQFAGHGLDDDGRVAGQLESTQAKPSFSAEPHQLGFGDRVQLTKQLFE